MKVLHILHKLCFSGAEIMYAGAADEFRKLGCELYVVDTSPQLGVFAPMFEKSGYKVLHLYYPKGILAHWRYYRMMLRLVKAEGIDVIHTHSSALKWGMALVGRMAGVRTVYTFHNCFRSRWFSWPYHWWLRWSAKHLLGEIFQTISDSVYTNELAYYFNPTEKVYNWYDSSRFFPSMEGEKQLVRRQLNIAEDAFVIISVGGCTVGKNHHDILRCMPRLLLRNPNTVYLHLGQGVTTAEELAMADELGVAHAVRFMGNQRDVRRFLVAADIYVMPSRYEGISITTIEALACRVPAVLYNAHGLRDFNAEKQCSMLVEQSPEQIIGAINELIGNPTLRERIVRNGYELVTRRFFMPTNVRRIYNLYTKKR